MHDSNCKGTLSNGIEAQNSNNIVLQKAKNVPEGSKGNFSGDSEGSNLVLDNSEKLASISAEKLLESELGSILEVTEEMLKSCRRRSVLKRKKSGFSDHLHDNNETDTDEVSGCTKKDKKRKERRVTFSDELEIQLPDGSKEVVEMESLNDSFEQMEIIDKQNIIEEDLPVFDDILSREMHAGEGEPNSENKEVDDVDGKDGEKIATEKAKSLQEKNDNEEKKALQSFESGGNEKCYENKDVPGSCVNENLAKESKKKGVRRKTQKGRKTASEQKSKQKNREIIADAEERGKEENDEMKIMEGNENMVPMEADILLSPDCHFQEVQLPSRDEDVSQDNNNTKTFILKEKNQLNSGTGNADDLCNSKIQKTGGRLQNITPRRGLGQQTNSDDNAKPSRRLMNVFDDEPELNEVPKKDIQYEEGEKQARRNTNGNKKKSTNRPVSKSKSVDASNMKIVEDVEKDRVQNLEKEQAKHIKDETASDNVSKIVQKKKVQNKKASRKTRKVRNSLIKIEQEDEQQENKQRGKRKRGKTIKQARKLSFVRDVADDIEKNAGEIKDNAENDDISKNCSPQQVSLLPNEVKSTGKRERRKKIIYSDDAEERSVVDKHYEDEGEKKLVFKKNNGKIRRWKTAVKVDQEDDVAETRKGEGNEDEIQRTINEENVKRRDARIKVNNDDHDEFGEERDEVDDNKDLKKRKTKKRPFESDDEEMNVIREEPPESKNVEGACVVDSIEDEREEHNIEETVKPEFITEVTGKVDGEVQPTLNKTLNEDCKDQVKNAENKKDENRKRKKTEDLDSNNHSNKTMKVDVEGAADTDQDNFDENKSMTDERKSPEHEIVVQDEQYDNEMQELNAKKADDVEIDGEDGKAISEEKVGQAIESDKTDTKIGKSYDIRKRRANLRSKRKLHEPEIEQHDNKIQDLDEREEEVRVEGDVELENNEAHKGSDEHTKDELKEKTEKRKNTKVSERKSDSTVVNSAKKIKSKKGKKIEAVIDSYTTSEGMAVDMQGENGSDENRMKSGKEDDKDKENCERETIKRGRKRGLAEMKNDNIQEKNENDIEEKQMETKVEEKVDDKHIENRGRKISTRGRKHDVAQMREVGVETEDKEKEVKNELVEIVDDEDKENGGEKTNKTGRKSGQENKIDETEKNGNEEGKRSKKGRAVRKSSIDEVANKK